MLISTVMRLVVLGVVASAVCVAFSHASGTQAPQATNVSEVDSVITELIEAFNRERALVGRSPLKLTPKLTEAARAHAHDMAKHEMLSHRGSDGTTPAQRVKQQGYPYQKIGENIASGQPTPEAVMQSWMQSPGHRRNILGDFAELGAARVSSQNGASYWCVVFALPLSSRSDSRAFSATLLASAFAPNMAETLVRGAEVRRVPRHVVTR